MKKKKGGHDFFQVPVLPAHIFRAGDVAAIVGIEKWRLEKFLTGKQFRLSPAGHIGEGKGSWRLFSHEDLYRLASADCMVKDGFTAKFVSLVLQDIEDRDLLDLDENGESKVPNLPVFRTEKGPHVGLTPGFANLQPYYVLPLRLLIRNVDKRIAERKRR